MPCWGVLLSSADVIISTASQQGSVMTSSKHDPRFKHHPHAHHHSHPDDHDHSHRRDYPPGSRLSRRHFLAASAGTLAGGLLLKVEQLAGRPLLAAPTAAKRIYLAPD